MKKFFSFLIILLADITSLILTFYLSYFLRVSIIPKLFNIEFPGFFPIQHFYKFSYLLFLFILIFAYEKLYTQRFDFFEEFLFIARGLLISIVLIAVIIYFSRTYEVFARTLFVLMLLTGIIIIPSIRYLVKKLLIISGLLIKNAAVIGKREKITKIMSILGKLKSSGYRIVGAVDLQKGTPGAKPTEYLGLIEQIKSIVHQHRIETLIIVSEDIDKEELNDLINRCENHVREIKIVTDSSYLKTIGVRTENIDELLIMRMANNLLSPANRFLKRGFDIFLSFLSIIFLIPLFIAVAITILLESRGPVLFVQERFGKGGKHFKLLKFRSMYSEADAKLKQFLEENPEAKDEWEQYKKLKRFDPRVTKTGRFLRRFSLDELPQLYNILKGNMSFVGPRPYLVREKKDIERSAAIIFLVRSGLTGLWQIRGRSNLSFDDRLKLDEFYVRNWSFRLDIIIILKTFGTVFKGKGAY